MAPSPRGGPRSRRRERLRFIGCWLKHFHRRSRWQRPTSTRNWGGASPGPTADSQRARYPPSTISGVPVTNDDSSEARNRIAFAISSGCALRPIGSARDALRQNSATSAGVERFRISVSTLPGHTQLTLIPSAAYREARDFVSCSAPAFVTLYANVLAPSISCPMKEEMDAKLTIDPFFWRSMLGMTCLQHKNMLFRLMS